MPKYTPARIEEIHSHLSRLAQDRISVADYAKQIGVAAWTIYTWKRRFGVATTRGSNDEVAELIEVESPAPTTDHLEIAVGSATIRVPPGCHAADLRTAWEVVRGC